jgi:agmatinase
MTRRLGLDGPTFADFPHCDDLDALDAEIAVVGLPYVSPYPGRWATSSADAPATIRRQSKRYARFDRYEFDFGGELLAGRSVAWADCGDLVKGPEPFEDYVDSVTRAIRTLLDRGAVPMVLGGDHGTTIPVLRAFENHGPLCLVQIDAHLDWLDQRDGVRDGYSSPMRRASEMPWVTSMAQIGLRGQGSARRQELDAAMAYGKSLLVRAEELHEQGMEAVLARIPECESYYLTIDADGLDPAIAPGVPVPTPGGVTYYQALNLMRGLARKGRLVGIDIVEVVPELDVQDLTSALAVRLLLDFIGVLAHRGQIGSYPKSL